MGPYHVTLLYPMSRTVRTTITRSNYMFNQNNLYSVVWFLQDIPIRNLPRTDYLENRGLSNRMEQAERTSWKKATHNSLSARSRDPLLYGCRPPNNSESEIIGRCCCRSCFD